MASNSESSLRIRLPQHGMQERTVDEEVGKYVSNFENSERETLAENAAEVTESFYHLVTDFYEYGWGQSFHFAPVMGDKTFAACIQEFERDMARALDAKPGMKLLDLGSGVGGPAREIAQFSGAHVTGINFSGYQIQRAKLLAEKANLGSLCDFVKGDFCNMECFEDGSFDGAYAFEAICHSKSLLEVYSEVYRVLKPGALFVDINWLTTDKYNPKNPDHVRIKDKIMLGNSLPALRTQQEALDALKKAGFQVLDSSDVANDGDLPWYTFLAGTRCLSTQNCRMSAFGRWVTHTFLTMFEFVRLVPRGTTKVHSVLLTAADGLVAAGKCGIFTPSFRMVAQKPLES